MCVTFLLHEVIKFMQNAFVTFQKSILYTNKINTCVHNDFYAYQYNFQENNKDPTMLL